MTGLNEKRSKRSLLLDPHFQGRIVALICLAGFLCIGVTGSLYYAYVDDSYDFILRYASLPAEIIDERYRDLYRLWVWLSLLNLLVILVVAAWALIATHRAAGSVYHMNRVILEVSAGNSAARIHLRRKDEFQELAHSLNAMLDELQQARAAAPSAPGSAAQ